jgi:hypothetical protein
VKNPKKLLSPKAGAFLLNVVHIAGAFRLCQYGQVREYGGEITIDCKHFQKELI